eukprot:3607404-Alexandrium_andersonii.AAC.1
MGWSAAIHLLLYNRCWLREGTAWGGDSGVSECWAALGWLGQGLRQMNPVDTRSFLGDRMQRRPSRG